MNHTAALIRAPRWRQMLPAYAPGGLAAAYCLLAYNSPAPARITAAVGAAVAVTLIGYLGMLVCVYATTRLQGAADADSLDPGQHAAALWAGVLLATCVWIWGQKYPQHGADSDSGLR